MKNEIKSQTQIEPEIVAETFNGDDTELDRGKTMKEPFSHKFVRVMGESLGYAAASLIVAIPLILTLGRKKK